MTESRREKLIGAVESLPTFVDDNHNLMLDRQRRHIRWLLNNGITDGNGVLLIAGGYGEGYFLEDDELFALIDTLMDEVGGKVPTMIGVFDLNARTAARRCKYAADAGVDFVELGLPHYACPSEDDVFLYTQWVNDQADIGIMLYNNFWVTPAPHFEITRSLIERLTELEHAVGFKWSSANAAHYMGMLKLFSDQFAFIDNGMVNSIGARLGMTGFVDFYGNVAPRLTLKKWELFRDGRYDELDKLLYQVHFDPDNELSNSNPGFQSVADGVFGHLRWRLLGLDAGPNFPAQAQPSEAVVDHTRKVIESSGVMEWTDFDMSVVEG